MNLSTILGNVTKVAGTAASLAGTYYQIKALSKGIPQAAAAPPPVTPAAPALPRTPYGAQIYSSQVPYSTRSFQGASIIPAALPAIAGAALPTIARGAMSLLSNAGKVAGIAAALGIGEEVVQSVLHLDRSTRRRRRRRMLTNSDVKDITVMASLLGKGSEAFKTWLATAQRGR